VASGATVAVKTRAARFTPRSLRGSLSLSTRTTSASSLTWTRQPSPSERLTPATNSEPRGPRRSTSPTLNAHSGHVQLAAQGRGQVGGAELPVTQRHPRLAHGGRRRRGAADE
jgi:hypothetical protein